MSLFFKCRKEKVKRCQKNKYLCKVQTPGKLKYGNKGFVPCYFPPLACSYWCWPFVLHSGYRCDAAVRWLNTVYKRSSLNLRNLHARQPIFNVDNTGVILSHSVETHTSCMCGFYSWCVFSSFDLRARSPVSVFIPGGEGSWLHRCVEIQITRQGVRESDDILMRRREGERKEKTYSVAQICNYSHNSPRTFPQ